MGQTSEICPPRRLSPNRASVTGVRKKLVNLSLTNDRQS